MENPGLSLRVARARDLLAIAILTAASACAERAPTASAGFVGRTDVPPPLVDVLKREIGGESRWIGLQGDEDGVLLGLNPFRVLAQQTDPAARIWARREVVIAVRADHPAAAAIGSEGFRAFTRPELRDRVAFPDPATSGVGLAVLAQIVREYGWGYPAAAYRNGALAIDEGALPVLLRSGDRAVGIGTRGAFEGLAGISIVIPGDLRLTVPALMSVHGEGLEAAMVLVERAVGTSAARRAAPRLEVLKPGDDRSPPEWLLDAHQRRAAILDRFRRVTGR